MPAPSRVAASLQRHLDLSVREAVPCYPMERALVKLRDPPNEALHVQLTRVGRIAATREARDVAQEREA